MLRDGLGDGLDTTEALGVGVAAAAVIGSTSAVSAIASIDRMFTVTSLSGRDREPGGAGSGARRRIHARRFEPSRATAGC
ncbi:hypothetical protein GCM10010170_015330 [Dactylosporangium salmoneum]|uniref:Uncharacterized protein n=1 Tax=Dactylosporangium salmoneum TaxID=53361 RepID=A0ABN3FQX0_9ACTN